MVAPHDRFQPLVIGLGELLWDVFPDGRRPGGAPANVAFHAGQCGCSGLVVSRVGCDEPGDALLAFLDEQGLETSHIQRDPEHPTGRVTVDLSDEGHPDYTIHEGVAWDFWEANDSVCEVMGRAAAVCFGTLAQRSPVSRESIHAALTACAPECLKVYDINLRQRWYARDWIERSLATADVLKLNRDEVAVVRELLSIDTDSHVEFARRIQGRFDVRLVCITRAEEGCLLVGPTETVNQPGRAVDVVDAVGAGDAFTAVLICGELRGWTLDWTAAVANQVGAYVATQAGAMPTLLPEFTALFEPV